MKKVKTRDKLISSILNVNEIENIIFMERKKKIVSSLIRHEVILERWEKSNFLYCHEFKKGVLIADLKMILNRVKFISFEVC
jgi:hypothetical protein